MINVLLQINKLKNLSYFSYLSLLYFDAD